MFNNNGNGSNNWKVSYSTISFFEKALDGHSNVDDFERSNDINFKILTFNRIILNIILVNEYCLGLAAVLKIKSEFPEIEYIVTSANWNGYTKEAKEYGRKNNIGIFNLSEFLGAMNFEQPKLFYKKDHKGNPTYAYKTA